MKLTIIETGLVPEPIREDFEDYPAMFRQLMLASDPSLQFDTVSVIKGEGLPSPEMCDAVLITGAPAGVYDDHAWIKDLIAFAQAAAKTKTPQVGLCFGHQLLAEALGGRVEKSSKGWGIGLHTYQMADAPEWFKGDWPKETSVAVSHQDQVVRCPPAAHVIASSEFTEYAGLYFPEAPAISFQCHPEFASEYSEALYDARRDRMGEDAVDAAIASLKGESDSARLGQVIAQFLRTYTV